MATLTVELESESIIDNASIYLEDPDETIEHKLQPEDDKHWTTEVSLPVDDQLDYALYVVAFSGTEFTCIITREDGKSIKLKGITGHPKKNRAEVVGAGTFENDDSL